MYCNVQCAHTAHTANTAYTAHKAHNAHTAQPAYTAYTANTAHTAHTDQVYYFDQAIRKTYKSIQFVRLISPFYRKKHLRYEI